MATLAAQIQTDLGVVVASEDMVDLTNTRDDDTAEDTAKTARVCAYVAAKIQAKLGSSVDGDDVEAVDLGVRWALSRLSRSLRLNAEVGSEEDIKSELEEMRVRRIANQNPPIVERCYDNQDERFLGHNTPGQSFSRARDIDRGERGRASSNDDSL